MTKTPIFLIVDGNAILHRAWHALPPLTTKSGVVVNAAYGFTMLLLKALKELEPKFVAVTFDMRGETFRHKAFAAYKAQRKKQPQELYDQIPLLKSILGGLGIPVLEKEGYEADDIIGTLTHLPEVKKGKTQARILTGDLDTLQLINDHVSVLVPQKGITNTTEYNADKVRERYDLEPAQLNDYKALRGDPSDNIPGVRGIGEKTGSALIKEFDSIEALVKFLVSGKEHQLLTPKVREALKTQEGELPALKKLVTIDCAVPLGKFTLADAKYGNIHSEVLYKIFQELEFKSLIDKIPGRKPSSTSSQKIGEPEEIAALPPQEGYRLVEDKQAFSKLMELLGCANAFAFDTETSSLDTIHADLLGISFSHRAGLGWYVPMNIVGQDEMIALKKLFAGLAVKIGHNIKFDQKMLRRVGLDVAGPLFDTMVASYLLNSASRAHSLDTLAFERFGHKMIPIERLIGKGKNQKSMADVPVRDVATYSAEDADYAFQLYEVFADELKRNDLVKVFETIEMPLISVLCDMELRGIRIDVEKINTLSEELGKRIVILEREIIKFAGKDFNVNSPNQLQEVLFTTLGLPTKGIKKTKTGLSTAADELDKLAGTHPIIALLGEYRELTKLKSTYTDALPLMADPKTQRIHTNFNQTIAATGRLSSVDPNLQNIPIRNELGAKVRETFVADKGYQLISADYAQMELRIVASLADDKKMIAAFKDGKDIHTITAAEINDVPLEKVTKEMRRAAKTINFGVLYGMGPVALARNTGLTNAQAKEFIAKYFALYRGIDRYLKDTIILAKRHGYVETLFGRKRMLPELSSGIPMLVAQAERMAINAPVQGTEADMVKLGMIALASKLTKVSPDAHLLLQVHDELVIEAPTSDVDAVAKLAKETLESVVTLKVPVVVDVKVGDNWGQMKRIL